MPGCGTWYPLGADHLTDIPPWSAFAVRAQGWIRAERLKGRRDNRPLFVCQIRVCVLDLLSKKLLSMKYVDWMVNDG